MRRALVGFLLVVLWAPAPARAQSPSILFVQPTRSETSVTMSGAGSAGAARIELSIPAGFTLDLTRLPGTLLGRTTVDIDSAAAPEGEGSTAEGDVVVSDPARYAADARIQACAPGKHAAVWRLEPLDLPIFVDPASGPDAALGGYDLRLCPELAPGLIFGDLELDLKRSVGVPATPGIYLWRAFVTPLTQTGVADERATCEAHGIVPWPAVLTLRAHRTAQKDRVRPLRPAPRRGEAARPRRRPSPRPADRAGGSEPGPHPLSAQVGRDGSLRPLPDDDPRATRGRVLRGVAADSAPRLLDTGDRSRRLRLRDDEPGAERAGDRAPAPFIRRASRRCGWPPEPGFARGL
jgi:hypothetical protein